MPVIKLENWKGKGVVVVPRVGENKNHRFRDPEVIYVDAQNHPMASVSSTEVRELLGSKSEESQQKLEKILHPKVLEYIRDHDLYS